MPRPRYQITKDDVTVVHRWVRGRFREHSWPRHWPELTAWDHFPLEKPTPKTLQRWCNRFLDASQWKQLQAAIRASRREKDATLTVRLSRHAYALLHDLAKREQLTLSGTIERYLAGLPTAPPGPATPTTSPILTPSMPVFQPPIPWLSQADTGQKVMQVKLYLRVENNSKFVRGRKKAIDEIERSVLRYYHMQKPHKDHGEYILSIPYDTDEDLDKTIDNILREASMTADDRHCCIEADVISLDDPDRSW